MAVVITSLDGGNSTNNHWCNISFSYFSAPSTTASNQDLHAFHTDANVTDNIATSMHVVTGLTANQNATFTLFFDSSGSGTCIVNEVDFMVMVP